MAYKEFYDSKDDMPRNWGYQSIPVSQLYRDNYDAIRWDSQGECLDDGGDE